MVVPGLVFLQYMYVCDSDDDNAEEEVDELDDDVVNGSNDVDGDRNEFFNESKQMWMNVLIV